MHKKTIKPSTPVLSLARNSPELLIAVDWSGRVDAAGQRRHIWAASWAASRTPDSMGAKIALEAGRTRDEVCDWLIAQAGKTPRMVVGFDFCFSYPAWFVREHGAKNAPHFWKMIADGHGERWLLRGCEDVRFWGKPRKKPLEFCGEHGHRMLRRTDVLSKVAAEIRDPVRAAKVAGIAPKSVFQIGGAGAVGTASLRGVHTLLRLRQAGFRIWPFDAPGADAPLAVEIYTRLMTGPVIKSSATARAAYLERKVADDPPYRALSRSVVAKAKASEDAFDALVSAMEMATHRDQFSGLKRASDATTRLEGRTWVPGIA